MVCFNLIFCVIVKEEIIAFNLKKMWVDTSDYLSGLIRVEGTVKSNLSAYSCIWHHSTQALSFILVTLSTICSLVYLSEKIPFLYISKGPLVNSTIYQVHYKNSLLLPPDQSSSWLINLIKHCSVTVYLNQLIIFYSSALLRPRFCVVQNNTVAILPFYSWRLEGYLSEE